MATRPSPSTTHCCWLCTCYRYVMDAAECDDDDDDDDDDVRDDDCFG